MTNATLFEADAMARKKPLSLPEGPIGPILWDNLKRLGYVEEVLRSNEIANRVTEKTGRKLTRQRVAQFVNAVRVNPETIEWLAAGLGVEPEDLIRTPKSPKRKG